MEPKTEPHNKKRVTKDRDERRRELIDVAERLFLSQGYENTGVSDIVRATNVAQGTFYYHFESKEDVLVEVVKKNVAELEAWVDEIVQKRELAPPARLDYLLALLLQFASVRKDLIADIHAEGNAPVHQRLMGTTSEMLRKYLLVLVQEGVETGHFRLPNIEAGVAFLLGGLGQLLHEPHWVQSRQALEPMGKTIGLMMARCLGMRDIE